MNPPPVASSRRVSGRYVLLALVAFVVALGLAIRLNVR